VSEVEGKDDCISYSVDGGVRGRIWIDPDTHEVMRLDQGLSGLVEVPMPRRVARRFNMSDSWTVERMDTSIRFKPVTFSDPDETLVLPVSSSQLRIARGAGQPRMRTVATCPLPALPHRRARRSTVGRAGPGQRMGDNFPFACPRCPNPASFTSTSLDTMPLALPTR
jgi:hypothetical protein